jgi:hypothetical protein
LHDLFLLSFALYTIGRLSLLMTSLVYPLYYLFKRICFLNIIVIKVLYKEINIILIFLLSPILQDCFGRPIASAPDAWFDVVERYSNDNNKTLK